MKIAKLAGVLAHAAAATIGRLYCYEDGSAIRNEASGEMRPEEFGRILQWLDPLGDEYADDPRWTARRPPSSI